MLLLIRGLADRGWHVELTAPAEGAFPAQARAAGISFAVAELPASLRIYGRQTNGKRALAALASLPVAWARLARWLKARADLVHIADHRGQLLLSPGRSPGSPADRLAHRLHGPEPGAERGLLPPGPPHRHPQQGGGRPPPGPSRRRQPDRHPQLRCPGWLEVPCRQPSDPPTVVTVGRLHPDKGTNVLLPSRPRRRWPRFVRLRGRPPGRDGSCPSPGCPAGAPPADGSAFLALSGNAGQALDMRLVAGYENAVPDRTLRLWRYLGGEDLGRWPTRRRPR